MDAVFLIRNKTNLAPIGVAMDYDCPGSYEIIEEVLNSQTEQIIY